MNKYTKLLKVFLVFFLVVALGYFIVAKANKSKTTNNAIQVQTTKVTIDASKFVGKTALEATQASVKEIKTEGTGTNAYITSLNGRIADAKKNEFWELTINGKPAEVGAGSYIIKLGDTIVWQIKTF